MAARSLSFLLLLLAFACSSGPVVEGRLSTPTTTSTSTSNSNDDVATTESESESELETVITTSIASASKEKFNSIIQSGSSRSSSMCDHIHPEELPEECSCREKTGQPFSLVIECLKPFNSTYFNDTIGMKIDLDPCNEDGAKLSLDVTEKDHNIDFPIVGIKAGESKNIPIPGLAMIVPGVGNVGVDVAVLIAGNPDILRLKIGLNACAQLSTDHQLCASSIPGVSNILPWYILKGTYSFGDICGTPSTTRTRISNDIDADVDVDSSSSNININNVEDGTTTIDSMILVE